MQSCWLECFWGKCLIPFMQTLQKALLDFEERQTACVEKTTGDERFVLVKKEEADGGIGNQLPTHITGRERSVLAFWICLRKDQSAFLDLHCTPDN